MFTSANYTGKSRKNHPVPEQETLKLLSPFLQPLSQGFLLLLTNPHSLLIDRRGKHRLGLLPDILQDMPGQPRPVKTGIQIDALQMGLIKALAGLSIILLIKGINPLCYSRVFSGSILLTSGFLFLLRTCPLLTHAKIFC